LFGGIGYAVDGEHVGRDAVVDVVGAGVSDDVVEALGHDVVEALVDFGLGPEVAHAVLDPLEVAGGDAAGVGEDVGDDEDALVREDLVGDCGGWAVGAFAEDLTAEAVGVAAGDDVFGGGGDEDLAVVGQELVLVGGLGLGEAVDGAGALAVLDERGDVDAVLVVEAAVVLGDAGDGVALFGEELGGVGADVAEALDDDAAAVDGHAEVFHGLVADDGDAAASCLFASAGAAEIDRLAGDDGVDGLAHVHGVGVHDPGHGLLVGAHVGGGDVFFGSDELHEFGGVAAGHAFELALGHFLWIADDAALGSAKGDVDDGALPGHPGGEGADFVEGDIGRVADAALGWAASDGVLDAIAGEDFNGAVVHAYGDVNDELARGIAENLPNAGVEVEFGGGEVESSGLSFPGICLLLEREGLHIVVPFFCCWYQRFSGHRLPPLEARIRLSQTGLWPNSRSIGWQTDDVQSNEWCRLTPFLTSYLTVG
jgi:hypothetical protein